MSLSMAAVINSVWRLVAEAALNVEYARLATVSGV
jgi:hypothetical protein